MQRCLYLVAILVLSATVSYGSPDDRFQANAYVNDHLADKEGKGLSKCIFTAGDLNTGKGYVRDPHLWCADLDLTCFSPWNSTEHNLQGGTLITRRHVLLANHFSNPTTGTPPMTPGTTVIEFVASDNTLYSRTISKLTQVKNTDLLIGTLDHDLPDKITPAQLFPFDQGKAVPPGTPLIYTNQEKWVCIGDCVSGTGPMVMLRPTAPEGRKIWTTPGPARIGDSGSPIFLPLHGRAVLLCHFFFANGGPGTGNYTAAINAITGPGYSVTEVKVTD